MGVKPLVKNRRKISDPGNSNPEILISDSSGVFYVAKPVLSRRRRYKQIPAAALKRAKLIRLKERRTGNNLIVKIMKGFTIGSDTDRGTSNFFSNAESKLPGDGSGVMKSRRNKKRQKIDIWEVREPLKVVRIDNETDANDRASSDEKPQSELINAITGGYIYDDDERSRLESITLKRSFDRRRELLQNS